MEPKDMLSEQAKFTINASSSSQAIG
jgi:hypothetical protein